jgi:hypothetical protein
VLFGPPAHIRRYRELRKALSRLQNAAVATVPKDVLLASGKKLGFLEGSSLVFSTEDESSVLMDYCIYDARLAGMSIIDRYCRDHPPPAGTDEEQLLGPIQAVRYTVLSVREAVPGKGVETWDEFRQEAAFLTDEGLSRTASRGILIATRLARTPEYTMTTGAALPLPAADLPLLWRRISAAFPGQQPQDLLDLSPEDRARLAALVIRTAIQRGASEHVGYLDPGGRLSSVPLPPRSLCREPQPMTGPNSPCYCGSGRKFKNCCGRRR